MGSTTPWGRSGTVCDRRPPAVTGPGKQRGLLGGVLIAAATTSGDV
jgi:hypothetical protein